MKKMESTLTNMIVVLVGVALVTGCLLAVVNHITEGPKAAQKTLALAEGIRTVMGNSDVTVSKTDTVCMTVNGKPTELIVHRVAGGGAAVESQTMGFGGDLRVLVGFADDGTITGYTVLQHAETPGLGAKAATWFQKDGKGNIIGKKAVKPLAVSKDGGEVDAITASTITSRAFLKAVNQAYAAYMQQSADAHTGATKIKKGWTTMNLLNIIKNGIIKENATFVLLLGMCPTLATTTSATNGLMMGLATMAVLICTNFVISCIKNITPDKVRIPVFVVVIATFVTILQMFIEAYLPDVNKSLGIYIPLIVVNCVILGRAEAFACKNTPLASIADGVGIGLGFALALTLLGAVREILGAGSLFGCTLLPETTNILLFVLPPGAFITLGYLVAVFNHFKKA